MISYENKSKTIFHATWGAGFDPLPGYCEGIVSFKIMVRGVAGFDPICG